MITRRQEQKPVWLQKSPEIIDLLATTPSTKVFSARVKDLRLSQTLEKKALLQAKVSGDILPTKNKRFLSLSDEKELATEVLLYRHRFTESVREIRKFRQATLTVIQNIYLFQNRKIFFGTTTLCAEQERQEALLLFGSEWHHKPLPLMKTFQHLILARIWNRILSQSNESTFRDCDFKKLHQIVEHLNTLRNIYMLLSANLVKKLVAKINKIYKESISHEDAVQIGNFGIARAAYRYHQSCGVRFSTYAASWVFKEIQRQALAGRLIKVSSNTVELYTRAIKEGNSRDIEKYATCLKQSTTTGIEQEKNYSNSFTPIQQFTTPPADEAERRQLHTILLDAIDHILPPRSGDVIKRRYGFPPYHCNPQSIMYISEQYGVTRGAIYQLEHTSLKKLSLHLKDTLA